MSEEGAPVPAPETSTPAPMPWEVPVDDAWYIISGAVNPNKPVSLSMRLVNGLVFGDVNQTVNQKEEELLAFAPPAEGWQAHDICINNLPIVRRAQYDWLAEQFKETYGVLQSLQERESRSVHRHMLKLRHLQYYFEQDREKPYSVLRPEFFQLLVAVMAENDDYEDRIFIDTEHSGSGEPLIVVRTKMGAIYLYDKSGLKEELLTAIKAKRGENVVAEEALPTSATTLPVATDAKVNSPWEKFTDAGLIKDQAQGYVIKVIGLSRTSNDEDGITNHYIVTIDGYEAITGILPTARRLNYGYRGVAKIENVNVENMYLRFERLV